MFVSLKCCSVLTCDHSFNMLLLNQTTLIDQSSVVHAEFVDINSDCLSGTCVYMIHIIIVYLD